MGFLDIFSKNKENKSIEDVIPVQESIPAFTNKGERTNPEVLDYQRGEGWEHLGELPGFGHLGLQSFNLFYNNYINKQYENEVAKIMAYREMAEFTEVADVIEDAVNESTQVDTDDRIIHLDILDDELAKNENIVKN